MSELSNLACKSLGMALLSWTRTSGARTFNLVTNGCSPARGTLPSFTVPSFTVPGSSHDSASASYSCVSMMGSPTCVENQPLGAQREACSWTPRAGDTFLLNCWLTVERVSVRLDESREM